MLKTILRDLTNSATKKIIINPTNYELKSRETMQFIYTDLAKNKGITNISFFYSDREYFSHNQISSFQNANLNPIKEGYNEELEKFTMALQNKILENFSFTFFEDYVCTKNKLCYPKSLSSCSTKKLLLTVIKSNKNTLKTFKIKFKEITTENLILNVISNLSKNKKLEELSINLEDCYKIKKCNKSNTLSMLLQIKSLLKALPKLKKISLFLPDYYTINSKDITSLAKVIKNHKLLKEVSLKLRICLKDAKTLAFGIAKNTSLNSVDFDYMPPFYSNYKFTEIEGIKNEPTISEIINQNNKIRCLSLSLNNTEESSSKTKEILAQKKELKKLCLDCSNGSFFTPKSIENILEGILENVSSPNSKIEEISLYLPKSYIDQPVKNNTGTASSNYQNRFEKCVNILASIFEKNNSLKSFDIRFNNENFLNNRGSIRLANAIKNNINITNLKINFHKFAKFRENNSSKKIYIAALFGIALSNNKSIESLELYLYKYPKAKVFAHINVADICAAIIKTNKNLKHFCFYTDQALKSPSYGCIYFNCSEMNPNYPATKIKESLLIGKALKSNSHLRTFKLACYYLDAPKEFLNLAKKNNSLSTFIVNETKINLDNPGILPPFEIMVRDIRPNYIADESLKITQQRQESLKLLQLAKKMQQGIKYIKLNELKNIFAFLKLDIKQINNPDYFTQQLFLLLQKIIQESNVDWITSAAYDLLFHEYQFIANHSLSQIEEYTIKYNELMLAALRCKANIVKLNNNSSNEYCHFVYAFLYPKGIYNPNLINKKPSHSEQKKCKIAHIFTQISLQSFEIAQTIIIKSKSKHYNNDHLLSLATNVNHLLKNLTSIKNTLLKTRKKQENFTKQDQNNFLFPANHKTNNMQKLKPKLETSLSKNHNTQNFSFLNKPLDITTKKYINKIAKIDIKLTNEILNLYFDELKLPVKTEQKNEFLTNSINILISNISNYFKTIKNERIKLDHKLLESKFQKYLKSNDFQKAFNLAFKNFQNISTKDEGKLLQTLMKAYSHNLNYVHSQTTPENEFTFSSESTVKNKSKSKI